MMGKRKITPRGRVDKRRQLVAHQALSLFVRLGYDKVSFQDISDATGVPRTALYRYYDTKRDIFDAAIIEVILRVRAELAEISARPIPAADRLGLVLDRFSDMLYAERDFVQVIFDFVMNKIAAGEDMASRIAEFTGGLKNTFTVLLKEGEADGSLHPTISPEIVSELFFALVESSALKMILGMEKSSEGTKYRLKSALASMRSRNQKEA